jgi:endonuclease VIII-like 1
MPELAELKLTADFVNSSCRDKLFFDSWKNPAHKGLIISGIYQILGTKDDFSISAQSRGKELKLILRSTNSKSIDLLFTMGMGGNFQFCTPPERPKHTHYSFINRDNLYELDFVDVRRFGRWKIGGWNPERGPDPTTEFEDFVKNIKNNIAHRDFNKPLYEWLMNQKWVNGFGNYLRAELCERLDTDPFKSARSVIISDYGEKLFELCHQLPWDAYELGGGQLYTWKNPNDEKPLKKLEWDEWMIAYKNKKFENMLDSNDRRFWFNPKWKKND